MPIVVLKQGNSCGAKGHYFSNKFSKEGVFSNWET